MQTQILTTHQNSYFPLTQDNALLSSWTVLSNGTGLSHEDFADAADLIEFVYGDAVRPALGTLRKRGYTSDAGEATYALEAIKRVMTRHQSFANPFDIDTDERSLVEDALATLREAVVGCVSFDMRSERLRQALRFLIWKSGRKWEFINFWHDLDMAGHTEGRFQAATTTFRGICRMFPEIHQR